MDFWNSIHVDWPFETIKNPSDSGAWVLVIATRILDLLVPGLDMLLTKEVITIYIDLELVLVIIGMVLC